MKVEKHSENKQEMEGGGNDDAEKLGMCERTEHQGCW